MIKAVFFDVDGTLLSHASRTVPLSTQQTLAKLRDKGIKTLIATGRHMLELFQLPVMDLPFDGYLTLNGQLVLDSAQKVIVGKTIKAEEMEILVNIFQAKKIPFMLLGQDNRYMNYVDDVVVQTLAAAHGFVPDIGQYHGEQIYQCIAFVPEREKELLKDFLDECSITTWGETGIDIIPKGGGKANGIQKYLEQLGIDRSEIMAFGDGENDIDMLKFAGIGVAMGNASDHVKAAADYVTTDIDDDGIAHALRHFGLIEE